ncbi:hypothetical protein HN954_01225 [bacterium]|nr:hypothetical protein [bacterium]MBT6832298.1 hypothetical protein [bacterium]MBT6996033.1 hypothetical protein [bacterium]
MKTFFGLILFFSLCGNGFVFAAPKELNCPRIPTEANCHASNFVKLSNALFEKELKYFDENVLVPAYADNRNNPNEIAQQLIFDSRVHHECLRKICETIFWACAPEDSGNQSFEQLNSCQATTETLFEIQREKVSALATENSARKNRELTREKFRAIEMRSSRYFLPKLKQLVREFKRFNDKVSLFLSTPR